MKIYKINKISRNIDYSNLSEEEQIRLVKENGLDIQYIKNPTLKVQLIAVKQHGFLIRHIQNPSIEVQLAAVKQDGSAIEYIKNPSLETQLEAVKEYGYVIQLIQNPSLEIQLIAITGKWAKQIIRNIDYYIPNQHPDLTKEYIKWIKIKINS